MRDQIPFMQARAFNTPTNLDRECLAEQATCGAPFLRRNKQFPLARDPVPRGRQITKPPTPLRYFHADLSLVAIQHG
jgi:hypothetical protein